MSVMLSQVAAVREKNNSGYLQDEPVETIARKKASLERDIRLLRSMMERAAEIEQSMTSELVLYLSRLLDKKINEHMKINITLRKKS